MPIDTERRIAFVHIPKTGGTSITSMFGLRQRENFFSPSPLEELIPSNKTPQHFTYIELKNNLPAGFLAGAYKFAIVRNPWDRFASEFFWRKALYLRLLQKGKKTFYENGDFESLEAFTKVLQWPDERRLDAKMGMDGHLETQRSFIVGEDGEIALDFIGRFENFGKDVRIVAKQCGIELTRRDHLMKSGRKRNYRQYYSAAARHAVESFYKDDISMFGYTF